MDRALRPDDLSPSARRIETVHEGAIVVRDRDHALDRVERIGEFSVLLVRHLVHVGLGIAPRVMHIRGIAVKERLFRVVEPNHIQRRSILDLDAQESPADFRQGFDAPEPPADNAAHSGAARVLAVRPAPHARGLRKAGSDLPCPDIEPSRTFEWGLCRVEVAGDSELLARERRKGNRLRQCLALLSEHTKKVAYFAVKIVVRLDR